MGFLRVGALLGGYEVEELIGTGGMSAVYRARQLALDRSVALKVMDESLASDPSYVERFRREARAAASLEHPHIVPVYDTGDADGRLFIAMRFVVGMDLSRVLKRDRVLPPDIAVRVVEQVAQALDAAHESGLIHRDVKPANVLIGGGSGTPHAYLSDFGVARPLDITASLTRTGIAVGTPGYMAPEVLRGGVCGTAADIYALGCVLFETLTGVPPFAGADPLTVIAAHLMDPPPTLGLRGIEAWAGNGRCHPPGAEQTAGRALSQCQQVLAGGMGSARGGE